MSTNLSYRRRVASIVRRSGRFDVWLVAVLAWLALLPGAVRTPFDSDESQWISTSRYLELFVGGRFGDEAWETGYWTLTQPPVARYFIGIGRLLGGYSDTELNTPWTFRRSAAENTAAGNMPSPDLLRWSRVPMTVLAVVPVVALFWLLKRAAGRRAAWLFVFLFLLSPYLRQTLSRAMGEAPLLAFTVLAMMAGERVLHYGRRATAGDETMSRRYLLWAGLMGLCAGLAGASKLNGLGVAAAAVAIAVVAAWPQAQEGSFRQRWRLAMWGSGIALAVAIAAFILINPYLYLSPIYHTGLMFVHRSREMARQVLGFQGSQMPGGLARLPASVARALWLSSAYPTRRAWWILGLLALVGCVATGSIIRRWRRGDESGAGLVAIMLTAASTVIPALFTPLNWGRYFLFPVVLTILLVALGLDFLWQQARLLWPQASRG